MKRVYGVLQVTGDSNRFSFAYFPTLKICESLVHVLRSAGVPAYVVVSRDDEVSLPPLVSMPGTDCDFKEKVGKLK